MNRLLIASAAILFAAAPSVALAAGASIDWDPVYTWEPGATATNSPFGGDLSAVGIVSDFNEPFDDLDANDPSTEYTIYIYGLDSQGTVASGPPAFTSYRTNYTGGTIEIYAGSPRNSVLDPNPPNPNVPSTFTDGTLILGGNFTNFFTVSNNFTQNKVGFMEGNIEFNTGTLLDRIPGYENEDPCPGLFTGGMTWRPDLLPAGYIFRHDGKIDLDCPVPTEETTWGTIKSRHGEE